MPFDWSEDNINQVSVVHEEILIPKSFGDLLATKYAGYVNNIPIPSSAIVIDDYSTDARTVHIVLNKLELLDLAKIRENTKLGMEFTLEPSKEVSFPQTAFTNNAQYKINLRWDPPTIVSGSTTRFFFDVQDPYLISDKTVSVSYDFSILQNEQEIYRQSGTSESNRENVIEVPLPNDVTGPIRIKFDNLGGNSFSSAEFLSVIEEPITLSPKFPITASSFLVQGNSKTYGKYEVDLTWFPSTILVDEQTEFVFTIKSKDTGQPVPQSTYNFVILQKGNEVYRKQGTAQAGGDYVDYTFFKGQDGPTVLRIENINNSGELVEIPIVVTPEFSSSIAAALIATLIAIVFAKGLRMIRILN
jgi:hypothetical protein